MCVTLIFLKKSIPMLSVVMQRVTTNIVTQFLSENEAKRGEMCHQHSDTKSTLANFKKFDQKFE